MQVHFDSYGGSVSEIRLGNHFTRVGFDEAERAQRENWVRLVRPGVARGRIFTTLMVLPGVETAKRMAADPSKVHWKHEVLEEGEGVRFVHEDARGLVLTKTVRAVPGTYDLDVELAVSSTEADLEGASLKFSLVAAVGMQAATSDAAYTEPQAVAAYVDGDPKTSGRRPRRQPRARDPEVRRGRADRLLRLPEQVLRDAHAPRRRVQRARAPGVVQGRGRGLRVGAGRREPARPGEALPRHARRGHDRLQGARGRGAERRRYELFAGPKDARSSSVTTRSTRRSCARTSASSTASPRSSSASCASSTGSSGNWGWAIILLTLTVRMLLFPLQRKMQTSMARHATKMRRVQPKIDAIKEKYAKDPQKLRQEQARIFQEEGAMPPIGGCLPIFLQIPIFFGLFSALRVAFDLRHQPFMGWIQDLSQPDRLITFADSYPFVGDAFNLLPILMVVLWIGQQKVMPKPATMNEQQAQMQKIMMWMPIMFGFFLYNYASGLSLYMITTSAFGIVESTVIRRVWPIDETEQPKKKSRFMARLEELQKQAVAMQEQQQKARGQQGKGGGKKRR